MGRDRDRWCLALRACVLLAALCVCVHLYLGRPAGRGGQVRPDGGGTPRETAGGGGGGGRGGEGGAPGPNGEDGALKRQVTYVRTPKRDTGADGGAPPGGEHPTACCPPLHPHRKVPRWRIDLQPWAAPSHALEEEALRFLNYIQTPHVSCGGPPGAGLPWRVCLDERFSLAHRIGSKHCRVYSLGLGMADKRLELGLAGAGCEVHCFDPSIKQPHLQDSSRMWLHRISVDWRDPNPAIPAHQQRGSTKKLAAILNDFGHRKIDVLKADMESAEWKILENLILEDVLQEIGQLLLEVHLHWPGFEVSGDDSAVVRYWYSLLRELQRHHFLLFYSHCDITKPRLFLHKNLFNASSSYTLGWVNTRWKPQ
ncbi:probable methyltransferase-like protein 24 [Anguilla rostrata]